MLIPHLPFKHKTFSVLWVTHAQKNTEETDPAELNHVNELRIRVEVIEAVRRAYPEQDLH